MIFCSECFRDEQIKSIIKSIKRKDDCPICGKRHSFIYDTEKDIILNDFFNELLDIYTPKSQLPVDYPSAEIHMIADEFKNEWKLFIDILKPSDVYNIITSISINMYTEFPELFDSPVGISQKYDIDYLKEHSILKGTQWNDFVECIKHENRFHTNIINTDKLSTYLSYLRKDYKKCSALFRGRLCNNDESFSKMEMGAPLRQYAREGRANSTGISRLYLANIAETCIHEIRAGAFDSISIGKFVLNQDIVIIDFKKINNFSPFNPDFDYLEYLINKPTLQRIDAEMGIAVRASDNHLDYIPTQYLCDFIKTLEYESGKKYSGVEYTSTLNSSGYNLAIFYPDLFKCTSVSTYTINELKYNFSKL